MKKFKILVICMMIFSFVIVGVGFAFLPDIIPIHFGIDGAPDQFGSKYFMLLFPTIITIIGGVALAVCRYAKVSENYKKYTSVSRGIDIANNDIMDIVFRKVRKYILEESQLKDAVAIIDEMETLLGK